MKSNAFKPALIVVSILIVAIVAVLFFYRISILKYTAETIIRNVLPDYVRVDAISFDLSLSRVSLKGFRIVNPAGFSSEYLLEIGEVSCRYKMKGKSVLDGLEIFDPVFKRPVFYIERRADGRLNLNEMSNVLQKGQGGASSGPMPPTVKAAREEAKAKGAAAGRAAGAAAMVGNKKLSDIVKLPETYGIKNGKIVFSDFAAPRGPHKLVFDDIEGSITVKLNDTYTKVLRVASAGDGYLNGHKSEIVRWTIDFNPNTPKLTMSNKFDVSGVDIRPFEPYYDRYSPLIFRSGTFSGTLVFDFDNGNIGSTNEVRLSGLSFIVKPGAENQQFWGSTVPDLARYFTTASGDILFDFKIKGDMAKPQFYFGPISKQALTLMAVDKISAALGAAAKGVSGDGSSPLTKEEAQAKAIADAMKLLFKKTK